MQRMFRAFAEQTRSDLRALAACIRGSRQTLTKGAARILPGAGRRRDEGRGGRRRSGAGRLLPHGAGLDIPGRDHNLAVGDKVYKEGVLAFLAERDLSDAADSARLAPARGYA